MEEGAHIVSKDLPPAGVAGQVDTLERKVQLAWKFELGSSLEVYIMGQELGLQPPNELEVLRKTVR